MAAVVGADPVQARAPVATLGLAGCALLALVLAVRFPISTTVLGLMAFGVLHNILEIRYVAGRFASLLSGEFLRLVLLAVTGIALSRLLLLAGWSGAPRLEIVLGYAVLALGAARGLTGRPRMAAYAALLLAGAVSWAHPAYHFVVLAHLHNVVPLVFLWEWSRRLRRGAGLFRAVQVGWVLIVPAIIVSGVLDGRLGNGAGVVARWVGDGSRVIAGSAPPDLAATTMGLRLLVVFAFLQTMHYVVWVGFFPSQAPEASRAFERRVPELPARRLWLLGVVGGLLLLLLFVSDYWTGKSVYAALATYHAYIEFPVLLALLLGGQAAWSSAEQERADEQGEPVGQR